LLHACRTLALLLTIDVHGLGQVSTFAKISAWPPMGPRIAGAITEKMSLVRLMSCSWFLAR
jgi:hypothetical protein